MSIILINFEARVTAQVMVSRYRVVASSTGIENVKSENIYRITNTSNAKRIKPLRTVKQADIKLTNVYKMCILRLPDFVNSGREISLSNATFTACISAFRSVRSPDFYFSLPLFRFLFLFLQSEN